MAITKERLEELINKGATIYTIKHIGVDVMELHLKNISDDFWYFLLGMTEELFEDKVEVEEKAKKIKWALKYHATRTEELNLPMWEEIQSNLDEVKNGKDKINISFIKRFNHSKLGYILLMLVKIEEKPIQLEVSNNVEYMQRWVATEENYIKACDLCVKLFKGEEE